MVIHDTITTNVRLHKIRPTDTEICTHCDRQVTVLRRLTECGVWQIWEWIRTRIARIQRTDQGPQGMAPSFLSPPKISDNVVLLARIFFYVVN